MKFVKTFKVLLGIQLAAFICALLIIFVSAHDGVDSFLGLAAIFPFGLFGILSIVNLVLLVVYLVNIGKKKYEYDSIIIVFVVLNVVLALSYNRLIALVSLAG